MKVITVASTVDDTEILRINSEQKYVISQEYILL
jgi:hypothetical protein